MGSGYSTAPSQFSPGNNGFSLRKNHRFRTFLIVHRRVAEDAKRMNIFLSAEGAERKKLSF